MTDSRLLLTSHRLTWIHAQSRPQHLTTHGFEDELWGRNLADYNQWSEVNTCAIMAEWLNHAVSSNMAINTTARGMGQATLEDLYQWGLPSLFRFEIQHQQQQSAISKTDNNNSTVIASLHHGSHRYLSLCATNHFSNRHFSSKSCFSRSKLEPNFKHLAIC